MTETTTPPVDADAQAPELIPLQVPEGLQLREPTGAVTFPFVLLEGIEKGGKTYAACQFAASPLVGHVFAIDLGDGTLDEYAPLGPYHIVVHNGTYSDILHRLELVLSIPSLPERPNVIIIDPITNLWKLIVNWLNGRARSSRANVNKLRNDPDAEVTITQNLWNDGKDRWRRIVDQLMTYRGIVLVTARGKEVTAVDANGSPIPGTKEWSVEAEKTLTWDVTAWVRFEQRGANPRLIGVRSLAVDVPAAGLELPRDNAVEHLVFTVLSAGQAFSQRDTSIPVVGVGAPQAKDRILHFLERQGVKADLAKQQAGVAWKACGLEGKREVNEGEIMSVITFLREANTGDWNKPPEDAPTETEHAQDEAAEAAQAPSAVDGFLGADLGAEDGTEPHSGSEGRRQITAAEVVALEQLAQVKGEPAPIFCTAGDGVIEPDDYAEGDDGRSWHVDCFPAPATEQVDEAPM